MNPDKFDVAGRASPVITGDGVIFFYNGSAKTVFLVGDYNRWELKDKMQKAEMAAVGILKKPFPITPDSIINL